VSEETQAALRQAYKILFREGLTIPKALARIESELPAMVDVKYLVHSSAPASGVSANEPY